MSRRLIVVASLALVVAAGCTMQHHYASSQSSAAVMDDHMAHMSAADLYPERTASTPSRRAPSAQDMRLPPSDSGAPARLKASQRHSEWVKIAYEPGSKDSLMAWVVYPAINRGGKVPVVVVVHEIFGLSTWIRGVADHVAAEGFIAIAPDFESRVRGGPSSETLTNDSARKIIGGVNMAERNTTIDAAANFAMTQPMAEQKYAVIGYCWGGGTVFGHAINNGVKGYSGGVAYYGLPPMSQGQRATATTPAVPGTFILDSLKKISKPVMLLNGDPRISTSMPALDSLMKSLKKDYAATDYPGAAHGFLRLQDDGGNNPAAAANLAATKDAWPKTIAFLKKNLGVK